MGFGDFINNALDKGKRFVAKGVEMAPDLLVNAKEGFNETFARGKNIVSKGTEIVKEKVDTFSGQKLLQQNQEYYEKVTQILVGLDSRLEQAEQRLSVVNSELQQFKNDIDSTISEHSKLLIDLDSKIENKKLKIPFYLYTIIVIQFILIAVLFYLVLFHAK